MKGCIVALLLTVLSTTLAALVTDESVVNSNPIIVCCTLYSKYYWIEILASSNNIDVCRHNARKFTLNLADAYFRPAINCFPLIAINPISTATA